MMRTKSHLLAMGLVALTGLSVVPMSAAEAQAQDGPQQAPSASDEIGDIVVTARRRAETSQSTPLSITAVTGAQLESRGSRSIVDLAQIAPNISFGQVGASPNAAAIAIRGVSFDDIDKSFDPAVGVLIDGVYLGTNTGALARAFDFESVEVLRGPQGTLFGRNTIGGVINIRRTRPTGELGVSANTTVGNYGRFDANAVVNLPKIGDVVSTKLFYQRAATNGFVRNVTTGEQSGRDRFHGYGVALLIEPTAAFNYLVTIERQRDRGINYYAPLSDATSDLICQIPPAFGGSPTNQCGRNAGKDLYTSFANDPNPIRYDFYGGTGEGNLKLGGLTLTSITAHQRSKQRLAIDFDASSAGVFSVVQPDRYRQFSQELRLAGNVIDTLDFVAGLYYFKSSYERQSTYIVFGAESPAPNGFGDARSFAIFGDIDWRLAPSWRLSVGGRYTSDRKSLNLFGLTDGTLSKSWSKFTPKVSLDWRPDDGVMLYASYSQGYRSGGYNGRAGTVSSASTPYDPETVTSFEIGSKTDFLDRRLRLNTAFFYSEFDNKQEEVVAGAPPPVFQETVVQNAAKARMYGAEVEAQAQLAKGLRFNANVGLLRAKYLSFEQCDPSIPGQCVVIDVSSRRLRRAPELTSSVGLNYSRSTGIGTFALGANYSHTSTQLLSIVPAVGNSYRNDPRCRQDAQDNADLSLTWQGTGSLEGVQVTAFGRNLLNDRGLNYCLPVGATGAATSPNLFTFASPRAPLTFGATLGIKLKP